MRLQRFLVGISPLLLAAFGAAGDTADTLDYARMPKVVRAVHAVATDF